MVAADPKADRVWVGWDTYESGNYSIRVRSLSGGPTPKLGDDRLIPNRRRCSRHIQPGVRRGRPVVGGVGRVRSAVGQGRRLLYGGEKRQDTTPSLRIAQPARRVSGRGQMAANPKPILRRAVAAGIAGIQRVAAIARRHGRPHVAGVPASHLPPSARGRLGGVRAAGTCTPPRFSATAGCRRSKCPASAGRNDMRIVFAARSARAASTSPMPATTAAGCRPAR